MACEEARLSQCIACAAWFSTGCVSYTATIDHDVRRGDLRLKLDSATVLRPRDPVHDRLRETRLSLTVEQVPADVTLLDAQLSSRTAPLCVWSQDARVGRSGGRESTAPLETNERLTLGFPSGFEVLHDESSRLDLLLETPEKHLRCVPVPVTDDGRPLQWRADQHLAIGVAFGVEEFTTHLGSVMQLGTFPLTVGWWVGPYRAEVAAGLALAGCPDTRCPVTAADSHINNSTTFVLAPGVGRALFEGGSFSVGATVRYRAVHLAANTFHGQEQLWMHGPVVIPYLGIGSAREFLLGFEFPVGYAFAENGDQTATVGFGLSLLGTVL
jgi:hypothetical protein